MDNVKVEVNIDMLRAIEALAIKALKPRVLFTGDMENMKEEAADITIECLHEIIGEVRSIEGVVPF